MSKVEMMHADSYLGYAIAASVISVSFRVYISFLYCNIIMKMLGHHAVGVACDQEKIKFGHQTIRGSRKIDRGHANSSHSAVGGELINH